jgi:quercetin dioxygenase-like cupin family protein
MNLDPVTTNPEHYRLVFENDRVRVLEYTDEPGTTTTPHDHPDSVMVTLTDFHRRLHSADAHMDVAMVAGKAQWLPAQRHFGENTGETPTHVLLIELKGAAAEPADRTVLGPTPGS